MPKLSHIEQFIRALIRLSGSFGATAVAASQLRCQHKLSKRQLRQKKPHQWRATSANTRAKDLAQKRTKRGINLPVRPRARDPTR